MNDSGDRPIDELAKKREEQRLQGLAKRALDDSVAELDEVTLATLAAARQRALAAKPVAANPESEILVSGNKAGWLLGCGAIAAALLVAVLWQQQLSPGGTAGQDAPELAVLDADEAWQVDEELLDEMDFYAWLAEQELAQLDQSHAG